ncbi:hypothetical protein BAUCODRAFT_37114 [Baudoinia panamericana UAMH 10762]|uniref:Transcription initiation factor TFIID subunit 1 histone acetyltransferase domain-containing protein n=1 Tax=Baudoinia panamericana (strain UAMH 10762) TaxID=717646 RepID=M2MPR9_BAUPA|nr:uncharacterized protein BAUCODRAFT_37114 [Baudoinia panamericana UAMH 10762]EMC93438.1 hypothetical protein BAUCODRAFT_37114 [Baudoinia panamericana UAMH 10762]
MPHAVDPVMMEDGDETEAAQRYLNEQGGLEAGLQDFFDRQIDQSNKHADAQDFEDIGSDDDLPDEEDASHMPGDDEDGGLDGFLGDNANGATYSNGHHTSHEPHDDEINELFGDRGSSPEQYRQHALPQQQPRPGGLALPSKSGLALPQIRQQQQSYSRPPQPTYSSMSPPSFASDTYSPAASDSMLITQEEEEEDDADMDEETRMQRMLFSQSKRRQAGQAVAEERQDVNPEEFWEFFPRYEADFAPRFLDLFPQRPVQYRGKVPAKPPRPVQPTKLSLDVLPDQEKSFKSLAGANRAGQDPGLATNLVTVHSGLTEDEGSDDDMAFSDVDEKAVVGGKSLADLAVICQSWDTPSIDSTSSLGDGDSLLDGEWQAEEHARPTKKQKMDGTAFDLSVQIDIPQAAFEDPEHVAAKLAKRVTLDLNDSNLLIDEHAPQPARRMKRVPGDLHQDQALSRDLVRRYNVSNDEAYDLLKENHQHKIRNTLGTTALEHSLPAKKLQFPFYKIILDAKAKRSFHRPALSLKDWEIRPQQKEFRFGKLKKVKNKERKGQEIKDLFSTADSLSLNDNSKLLLLEYSEEAPMMMSNFGMGNRLVNYYRKRNADDQERPKRDIGETHVLLTQDKSPFANFGHVDQGETVPTLQNGLYRAPVFQHQTRPTDFFIAVSTTHQYGTRMWLRNMENLHTVGQQLPMAEVPTAHSRKVTEAAKKRLRTLAYRVYLKSQDPTRRDKTLDNITIMKHLKGHDMPQTRSKMREFMTYQRNANREGGVWVPPAGTAVPDLETLRGEIKPEEVCLLDSMQAGVQRLNDLGINQKGETEKDDEKEIDENADIEKHLAPWRATKTFLQATQGKAMLKLHGDGDPTGRGEAFSFVKINMKGGFQPLGESVEDKLDAKRRRENGGHTYNVAKQQKAYDGYIRMIWEKQKNSLSSNIEISDVDMDDDPEAEAESAQAYGRSGTPRSSFPGTPAYGRRGDDETGTQFSRQSAGRDGKSVLVINRVGARDAYGQEMSEPVEIRNSRVIKEYLKRKAEKRLAAIDVSKYEFTGEDRELDNLVAKHIEQERDRVQRNIDRREARENLKKRVTGGAAGSPSESAAGSPGPSENESTITGAVGTSANGTPQKGRRGQKDGTARKCANCGQVGHIKTNRKLCPMLNGTMKTEDANPSGDSSFGAVPAPLTL